MASDHEIAFAYAGLMHQYQKANNVKQECVTNVQYLIDQLHSIGIKCKASAVIVMSKNVINRGHVVIILDDGSVVDPSYEIAKLQNIQYYDNIRAFTDIFHKECFEDEQTKTDFLKLVIKDFLHFTGLADKINNSLQHGNSFLVFDEEHYNKQADFMDDFMRSFSKYLENRE